MLTLPQLTVKGSGWPRPPSASATTARAGGAGGLRRGWMATAAPAVPAPPETRLRARPEAPASQRLTGVVGVCSPFPHNRLGALLGFLSRGALPRPGVPGLVPGRCSQPWWRPAGCGHLGESAGEFLEPSEGSALPCPEGSAQPSPALPYPSPLTSPGLEDINRNNILKHSF